MVIGQIADRWGRKWTSVVVALLQAATGFVMAFRLFYTVAVKDTSVYY